jgi:hypothetical protein
MVLARGSVRISGDESLCSLVGDIHIFKGKNIEVDRFLEVTLNSYRSDTSYHAGKDTRRWDNPLFYQKVNPELCNGLYWKDFICSLGFFYLQSLLRLSIFTKINV